MNRLIYQIALSAIESVDIKIQSPNLRRKENVAFFFGALELGASSHGTCFPSIFPAKQESQSTEEIICILSYGEVFPLYRGNYDHVTSANEDHFPALLGKCVHMGKCFFC